MIDVPAKAREWMAKRHALQTSTLAEHHVAGLLRAAIAEALEDAARGGCDTSEHPGANYDCIDPDDLRALAARYRKGERA